MNLDGASLALASSWGQELLIMVHATHAIRMCRDGGYQAPSYQQARASVDGLGRRDMMGVRAFVARTHLSGLLLRELDDPQLLALLRKSIKTRELVVLRKCKDEGGGEGSSTLEQRRLVRAIEAETRRRLHYNGRQYKLVSDADLRKLSDRDSYEVVRRVDAVMVLDGLAKQARAETGELVTLLAKARDKLTRDWRPPLHPDGLILLRRIIRQRASADSGPAMTPSQIKKLATKSDWIEIEVVDQDGTPYTGGYRIEFPNSTTSEANFDDEGFFGKYDLDPGNCTLVLTDLAPPNGATSKAAVPTSSGGGNAPGTPDAEATDAEAADAGTTDAGAADAEIEVHIFDAAGRPAKSLFYELTLPDGDKRTGISDDTGVIKISSLTQKGDCTLVFPDIDDAAKKN